MIYVSTGISGNLGVRGKEHIITNAALAKSLIKKGFLMKCEEDVIVPDVKAQPTPKEEEVKELEFVKVHNIVPPKVEITPANPEERKPIAERRKKEKPPKPVAKKRITKK